MVNINLIGGILFVYAIFPLRFCFVNILIAIIILTFQRTVCLNYKKTGEREILLHLFPN